MATNFGVIEPVVIEKFTFRRGFGTILSPQDSINFVGLSSSLVLITLNYDKTPILTSASLIPGNWVITGAGSPSVSAVSVISNQIQLTVSGLAPSTTYTLSVPSGITADSGLIGEPLYYAGPFELSFGLGQAGGAGSAFNNGFN